MGNGFFPGTTDSRLSVTDAWVWGFQDPTIISTAGRRGAMYTQIGTLNVYQKLDDGCTTNWQLFAGGGGGFTPGTIYNIAPGVVIGDFVYVSGASTVDKAIGNDITKKFSIGVVIDLPTPTTARVLSYGNTGALFLGLTPNLPVFLSVTTAGGITQTPPTGNIWRQILGMACSANEIELLIQEPIRRRA